VFTNDQFSDRSLRPRLILVAESFNQGFVALPKEVTGFLFRKMKLLSRWAAHVCAAASALRSRGGLHDPRSLRDAAARGSRPSAEAGANAVSAGLRLQARSLPRRDGPAHPNREPERPPQGPGTRVAAAVCATDAIPADGFQQPAPTMAAPGVVSAPSRPGLAGR
jgi:hypothetical protein